MREVAEADGGAVELALEEAFREEEGIRRVHVGLVIEDARARIRPPEYPSETKRTPGM